MNRIVIQSSKHFMEWCDDNWESVMSIDFETTSLKYTEMKIVGFSLCNGKEVCYVGMTSSEDFYLSNELKGLIQNTNDLILIMHNAVFDMKCLQGFIEITDGFTPFCSLVGAKLIDETRTGKNAYSLKRLAEDWLHISPDEIKTWDEVSTLGYTSPQFIDYAMNDSIWAWDLYELEKRKLKEQNLDYLFNEIEMPFQFVIRDMEVNGIKVDQNKLKDFEIKTGDELLRIEREMLKIFGLKHFIQGKLFGGQKYISPINFGSSKQLIDLIEFQLKFAVDVYTKPSKRFPKGQKSLGVEYMKKMKGKHKFFDLLWNHKKCLKLYNSFITNCPNFIESDGRVRPSYFLKRSGRLSCSEPALHQLPNPKKEKLIINYREVFVPEPGNVVVKGDWSGQELRVLAEISKDKNLINAFKDDIDVHLLTANSVFSLVLTREQICTKHSDYETIKKKYEQERHKAKNGVNFPIVYGISPYGISKNMGVSKTVAESWMKNFFELFPDVKKAIDDTKEFLIENNYVSTLMGRKRRYPYYAAQSKYQQAKILRSAFNHKVQGFSADMKKIAAINALKILSDYQAKIVLEIHDELIFECPKERAEKFAKKLKEIMQNAVCISVSLPVDVKICNNLG